MSYRNRLILLVCLALPLAACAKHYGKKQYYKTGYAEKKEHLGPPSDGAKGMPGAKGTFALYPPTSYWVDTDGVAPGVAGCHFGTNEKGEPNGRAFAEGCREDGLLIESNPGKGEVHPHARDTGHPDLFDCDVWCKGTGHDGGMCKTVPAPEPCISIDPEMTSGMCVCE